MTESEKATIIAGNEPLVVTGGYIWDSISTDYGKGDTEMGNLDIAQMVYVAFMFAAGAALVGWVRKKRLTVYRFTDI